jgi:UDP-hydrolysing UDP-N-acetyl-D-glucosamine 2-epimerase
LAKRRIVAITGYRSEYLKIKTALHCLAQRSEIDLSVIAIGAHALGGFGNTVRELREDGLDVVATLCTNVEGSSPNAMATSVGLGTVELSALLSVLKPDLVLLAADRYEIFSAAIAVAINNIPMAHVQGGEVSGTIDESLRHAITKLAHIHFPSTELSAKRLVRMGENPRFVFNVGCPALDFIMRCPIDKDRSRFLSQHFPALDPFRDFGVIIQHGVTTEYGQAYEQMVVTLTAVQENNLQSVLIYSNPDAGEDEIRRAIRFFERTYGPKFVCPEQTHQWKTIPFDMFLNLLYHSGCLIGNSSSGIRESHVYGIPSINIGTRQRGRERTPNVIDVNHDAVQISAAIQKWCGKRIDCGNHLYGVGDAGQRISDILCSLTDEEIHLSLQKVFYD